mgnify:CR=1 FL=1
MFTADVGTGKITFLVLFSLFLTTFIDCGLAVAVWWYTVPAVNWSVAVALFLIGLRSLGMANGAEDGSRRRSALPLVVLPLIFLIASIILWRTGLLDALAFGLLV